MSEIGQVITTPGRRSRIDLMTPAELGIREALSKVEEVGAHPLLTDAVKLLSQAQGKVADYVDYHQPHKEPDRGVSELPK